MAPSSPGHGRDSGASAPDGAASLAGLRILVVDDDADTRQLEKLIFVRAGAIVAEAPSADVAFQAVCDFKPHLVVSDVHMPCGDGYSLMRRIRALAAHLGGSVPAIAVSGGSGGAARREALRAGFSVHLTKPVAVAELLGAALTLSAVILR